MFNPKILFIMRKLFYCLVAVLALSVYDASAQKKGDLYVGAGLGLGTSSAILGDMSVTDVSFNIVPEVGYFVADRFMVGFGVGYDLMASGGDVQHGLALGPQFAYYVPLCDKLYYTPSLQLAFCLVAADGAAVPGFGLGATLAGVEYRPTERIGLSASLLSLNYKLLSSDGITLHNVDLGLSISPKVGVKFYF